MNRVNELKIYNFFHICARATLKEANYNGVFILFIYFAVNIMSFRVLTVHCQISSPEAIILLTLLKRLTKMYKLRPYKRQFTVLYLEQAVKWNCVVMYFVLFLVDIYSKSRREFHLYLLSRCRLSTNNY